MLSTDVKEHLQEGAVIPAHPLALTEDRKLDEKGQRALTRYYIDAGVGGIAVGVHTTQFEIRNKDINLFKPVLEMAIEEVELANVPANFIKVGGISGDTEQAIREAEFMKEIGYDLALLSVGGLQEKSEEELLERTREVAKIIPIFGFYLQPAVGGRILPYHFWRKLVEIPNVHAIKIAPFNRYQTLDVVRAVCESPRYDEIALYTGNDDNIIADLLTTYRFEVNGEQRQKKIVGGLLGHWAIWTKTTVELFEEIKKIRNREEISQKWLTIGQEITDVNAAVFDVQHAFKGCIAGINEVLARQGILQGNWCLMDEDVLSPGQKEEIDRVYKEYPHLNDDDFVEANLDKWLSN